MSLPRSIFRLSLITGLAGFALVGTATTSLASALKLRETEITLRPNQFLKPSLQKDAQARVDEEAGVWTYTLRARQFEPPVNLAAPGGDAGSATDPVLELLGRYLEALRAWDLDAVKALVDPESVEPFMAALESGPSAEQLRKDYAALEVYEPVLIAEFKQPGQALVFSRIKTAHSSGGYIPVCLVEKGGKLMLTHTSLGRSYALNFLLALKDDALRTR